MQIPQTELDKLLVQVRRISEHRVADAEKYIRHTYRRGLIELRGVLGNVYAANSVNGVLTMRELQAAGGYARYLEEVDKCIDGIHADVSKLIRKTVADTYKMCYDGMVDAVKNAKTYQDLADAFNGVLGVTPDTVKRVVNAPINRLTLQGRLARNRQQTLATIRQHLAIGLQNGDRYTTVAKRISDTLNMDYKKAILTVRTETHRVREQGFNDGGNRLQSNLIGSGFVLTKQWKTMLDGSVRHTDTADHVHMQDQLILQDEDFDLGHGVKAPCPGSSGTACNDCNCRCYVSDDLMTVEEFEQKTGRKLDDKYYKKEFTNDADGGRIETGDQKTIHSIESPIEQRHTGKGNPNAILLFDTDLTNRQKRLLENLPDFDSRIVVRKSDVNMSDLSALTAKTGHEFAMFTRGNERLIVRGNQAMVNIDVEMARSLADQGYRWSGHTHPGIDFLCMQPSDGDYAVLEGFKQQYTVVYNSKGEFRTFERRD